MASTQSDKPKVYYSSNPNFVGQAPNSITVYVTKSGKTTGKTSQKGVTVPENIDTRATYYTTESTGKGASRASGQQILTGAIRGQVNLTQATGETSSSQVTQDNRLTQGAVKSSGAVAQAVGQGGVLQEEYKAKPSVFITLKNFGKAVANVGVIGEQGFGAYRKNIRDSYSSYESVDVNKDIFKDFREIPSGTAIRRDFDINKLTTGQIKYYSEIREGVPFSMAGKTTPAKFGVIEDIKVKEFQRKIDTGELMYVTPQEKEVVNKQFQANVLKEYEFVRQQELGVAKNFQVVNPAEKYVFGAKLGATIAVSSTPVGMAGLAGYYGGTASGNFAKAIYRKDLSTSARLTEAGVGTLKLGFVGLGTAQVRNMLSRQNVFERYAEEMNQPVKLTGYPKSLGRNQFGAEVYQFRGSSSVSSSSLRQIEMTAPVYRTAEGFSLQGGKAVSKLNVYDFVSEKTFKFTSETKLYTKFPISEVSVAGVAYKQRSGLVLSNVKDFIGQEGRVFIEGKEGIQSISLFGVGRKTPEGYTFLTVSPTKADLYKPTMNINYKSPKLTEVTYTSSLSVKVFGKLMGSGIVKKPSAFYELVDLSGKTRPNSFIRVTFDKSVLGGETKSYVTLVGNKKSSELFLKSLYSNKVPTEAVAVQIQQSTFSKVAFIPKQVIVEQLPQTTRTASAFAGLGLYERTEAMAMQVFAPQVKLRERQVLAPLTTQTTTQRGAGGELFVIPTVSPTLRGSQKQFIIPIQTQTTPQIQLQSFPKPFNVPTTSPNTFFFNPDFSLPFDSFFTPKLSFDFSSGSRRIKSKRQRKKYTPDYAALIFGRRGKQPKGLETGIRPRPIPRGFKFEFGRIKL